MSHRRAKRERHRLPPPEDAGRRREAALIGGALMLLPIGLARIGAIPPFSCIRNHRLLLDVLTHFGVPVTPFPCRLAIFNPVAAHLLDEYGAVPQNDAEVEAWTTAGGFYLATPQPAALPGRFNGHLMLVVADHWLLDATIQQYHRPHRGVVIEQPLVVPVPKVVQGAADWDLDGPGGIRLLIQRDESLRDGDDKPYDQCSGWQHREPWNSLTRWMIQQIETIMARSEEENA